MQIIFLLYQSLDTLILTAFNIFARKYVNDSAISFLF